MLQMKRIPLPVGAQIQSDSLSFTIDSVLGYGANCIVYKAHYDDGYKHDKKVIMKECYPIRASVSRQEHTLTWDSVDEMQSAFDRMQWSYDLASEMQDSDVTRSASVYTLDKISANGTQYIIMIPQHGHSYDKDKSTDIADIIRTVLALCNAVGLYHQAGYLHLDIKPSNFIATIDHTGKGKNIALFDLDTLVALDDLQNASVAGVSYTKEWAAPEQKQMQIAKLCPATDLFAIGAILFERIMHRMPANADMSPFATWKFDERFSAKKVNPKAKRLLTDIFHKTLSANVKRRYQYAINLADALGELLDVVCGKAPYIISSIPVSTCSFVGRTEEIAELDRSLKGSSTVFINGDGGIGKTELIKYYVSSHKDHYDAVVFMVYNGSVSESLDDIEIFGYSNSLGTKRSILKQLSNENILLVLDNYDVSLDEETDINNLLDLNCKKVITTRTDFSEIYRNAKHFYLEGLAPDELKQITENELGHPLSKSEFDKLFPLWKLGEECTYYWVLLSRLIKKGEYSIDEIVKKAQNGLEGFNDSEKIIDTKDNLIIKRTISKALANLFALDHIDENDYEVLEMLYYLDCLMIKKKQIKSLFACDDSVPTSSRMDSLNSLIERGYINEQLGNCILSDVFKNVLKNERQPRISQSRLVVSILKSKFFFSHDEYLQNMQHDEMAKDHCAYILKCVFCIFKSVDWDFCDNAYFFIDYLYDMIGGGDLNFEDDYDFYKCLRNNYEIEIHDKLKKYIGNPNSHILFLKACILLCVFFAHIIMLIEEKEGDDASGWNVFEKLTPNSAKIAEIMRDLFSVIRDKIDSLEKRFELDRKYLHKESETKKKYFTELCLPYMKLMLEFPVLKFMIFDDILDEIFYLYEDDEIEYVKGMKELFETLPGIKIEVDDDSPSEENTSMDSIEKVKGYESRIIDFYDITDGNISTAEQLNDAIEFLSLRFMGDKTPKEQLYEMSLCIESLDSVIKNNNLSAYYPVKYYGRIVSYKDAIARYETFKAEFYCLKHNIGNAKLSIEKVISLAKEQLYNFTDKEVEESIKTRDLKCYFDNLKISLSFCYNSILQPYMLVWFDIVKQRLNIKTDNDPRLYNLYKDIITVTKDAREEIVPDFNIKTVLWAIFAPFDSEDDREYDGIQFKDIENPYKDKRIHEWCNTITKYSRIIRDMSGAEFSTDLFDRLDLDEDLEDMDDE